MTDERKPGSWTVINLPDGDFEGQPKVVEKREFPAKSADDLVAKYKIFAETGAKTDVVYHPCCATDCSPSVAFPSSRVIYVDKDAMAMEAMLKAGFEAHSGSALEFNPGKVNVLILLNPAIVPDYPSQFVEMGGHIICNDYHGTASDFKKNPDYELKGMIRKVDGKLMMDTDSLEDYWREVETEDEWKRAPFSWGACYYETAAQIVALVTGKRENVASEYKRLLETVKERNREKYAALLTAHPEMAGMVGDDEVLMLKHGDRTFALETKLPSKKGTVDDLFVFEKIKQQQTEVDLEIEDTAKSLEKFV